VQWRPLARGHTSANPGPPHVALRSYGALKFHRQALGSSRTGCSLHSDTLRAPLLLSDCVCYCTLISPVGATARQEGDGVRTSEWKECRPRDRVADGRDRRSRWRGPSVGRSGREGWTPPRSSALNTWSHHGIGLASDLHRNGHGPHRGRS